MMHWMVDDALGKPFLVCPILRQIGFFWGNKEGSTNIEEDKNIMDASAFSMEV